jgi:gamma-glutamylputrescine oxidase
MQLNIQSFSYWERTAFIDNADVIIIGSGLVGLSAALNLKKRQPGLKVLVLERGFLPTGASTKNAGFACFGSLSELLTSLQHSTEAEVARLVNYKWRGLQRLRENLGDDAIEYHQHGGYELFMEDEHEASESSLGQIDRINNLLKNAIGKTTVYSVADDKIAAFGFKGVAHMVYNPYEGQLHTGKMMRSLLNMVYHHDVLVLNGCSVAKVETTETRVHIVTNQGSFTAKKVILATNAFAKQLFPDLNVVPGRGQVLVTKPIGGLKLKGTYHFEEGYYYFRNIDNRVLFGGGRNLDFETEETWEFGQTELVKEKLLNHLKQMILPDQDFEIDYWWSGIMGFGEALAPIVKEVEPNIFCAVRCNGMGVAMGSLVGAEVAALALGEYL